MTILKLRSSGELLATLPHMLGFTPVESVVVVAVRDGGQLGGVMRVDRDDCLIPDVMASIARTVNSQLARDRAVTAILVSYTGHDVRVSCDAADAMGEAIAPLVRHIDAWAVTDGRYFAPGCADVACCPVAGTAVPDQDWEMVERPRLDARSGTGHAPPRVAWGSAPAAARRRSARAGDRWLAKSNADLARWRHDSYDLWRAAIARPPGEGVDLAQPDVGRLIAGLTDVRVRDAVIVSLIPGATAAAGDVLAGIESTRVGEALDSVLSPATGAVCEATQAAAVRAVLKQCVAHCRRKDAAPLLTLHGLVEWWMGQPVTGLALCDAAAASASGYRLADLVRATIEAGVTPGWQQ